MTWTYNTANDIGKVRLLIQDTDTNDQLLSDEEIQVFIDRNVDLDTAAARAARSIARQLIRRLNLEAAPGGASLYRKEQAEMYDKLATELEDNAASGTSTMQLLTISTAVDHDNA